MAMYPLKDRTLTLANLGRHWSRFLPGSPPWEKVANHTFWATSGAASSPCWMGKSGHSSHRQVPGLSKSAFKKAWDQYASWRNSGRPPST
jgi:hypothetical protein